MAVEIRVQDRFTGELGLLLEMLDRPDSRPLRLIERLARLLDMVSCDDFDPQPAAFAVCNATQRRLMLATLLGALGAQIEQRMNQGAS